VADSFRESILTRMKNNLNAATGVTVYRSRVEPIARNESPAIIIEPISDQPTDGTFFQKLDWSMRVRVTTIVRNAIPDDVSDQFTQQITELIMADQTMNGYARDTTPDRVEFNLYEADVPLGVVTQDFIVRYRTSRTDLTSA
jgi:hypothetical protein